MITSEEAARLLTAEAEQTIALLGGRLVGGGVAVSSIRIAVGQTGAVAEEDSFLFSPATEGRPGWAVEVQLEATGEGAFEEAPEPEAAPPPPDTVLAALAAEPCDVLRGVSSDAVEELRALGIRYVAELASLPEDRLGELLRPDTGLRLVDAWSRAQLLRVPLEPPLVEPLASYRLDDLVAASPQRLRDLGLPADTADADAERLSRTFTLLGAALDVRVLRDLWVSDLLAGEVG